MIILVGNKKLLVISEREQNLYPQSLHESDSCKKEETQFNNKWKKSYFYEGGKIKHVYIFLRGEKSFKNARIILSFLLSR